MPNPHFIIDRLFSAHNERRIRLPPATYAFLETAQVKAHAVPPELNLEEATIVECLYKTYLPWEAK